MWRERGNKDGGGVSAVSLIFLQGVGVKTPSTADKQPHDGRTRELELSELRYSTNTTQLHDLTVTLTTNTSNICR